MVDKLVSVIIPIYQSEKYLKRCVDSVISQTYSNLEIILVDDGSNDNSSLICDEYSKMDNRIVVIHKDNGGLSSARNAGLDIAKGDFISFVDSDDYIEPTMIEDLLNCMERNDSDLAVCNFYRVKGSSRKYRKFDSVEYTCFDFDKYFCMENKFRKLSEYAWNKLYKKSLFDVVRYPDGLIYEDIYVVCDIFDRANKVSYFAKPLYNYVYRGDSIVNNFNINHFTIIDSIEKKISFFQERKMEDYVIIESNRKMLLLIYRLAKMKHYKINNPSVYYFNICRLHDVNKTLLWRKCSFFNKFYKLFGDLLISVISFFVPILDK